MQLITDTIDEVKNMKPRKVFNFHLPLLKPSKKDLASNYKLAFNSMLGSDNLEKFDDFILL